jgi:hypothetical protein
MTYFIKNGNTFNPTDEQNLDIHTKLPAGNFVIKMDPNTRALYFEQVSEFQFPSKRYGDNPRHATRILETFYARSNGTGVMLTGEKGSGKSLLARTVSMEALQKDTPTIIIDSPWCGDAFNTLIQGIQQPAVILFDEFEKVYTSEQQELILTLLDGVFPTQKLFMFTCNDKWRVDRHMRNRPGRIFYMLDFKGLDGEFIQEYCEDNLKAKEHIPTIRTVCSMFSQFNFDMLKALVEEMNRFDEAPAAALAMLNIRPEFDDAKPQHNLMLTINGKVAKITYPRPVVWSGNPLTDHIHVYYNLPVKQVGFTSGSNSLATAHGEDDDDDDQKQDTLIFSPDDLSGMSGMQYTFKKGDAVLTVTRKVPDEKVNWLDSL